MFTKKTFFIGAVGLGLCAVLLLGIGWWQRAHASTFVSVLNIGQGDAILIESKTGDTVLIDTGPDNRVISELSQVLPVYDKTIETLVITHPDSDHIGGAVAVMSHYTVGRVLTSGLRDNETCRKVLKMIHDKKIPLIAADATSDFAFENGDSDGFFDVLWPLIPLVYAHEDANNDSVVMRFMIDNTSFLFEGDAEKETEAKLVEAYGKSGKLDAEILKVGHHGSKTSSTEEFLKAVSPKLALGSMGRHNKFDHPHTETVNRLKTMHIPFRRTDLEGRITLPLY